MTILAKKINILPIRTKCVHLEYDSRVKNINKKGIK